ncbi:hypothetical protein Vadar_008908 [Vaccinium darrowii]|uniref:Uncharacterized protein n=1 Tax=Vaccinium darrowii TaxID=229202 RepID=A0ACB7YLB8_9ERIC|nr:hypothetical protein Vadar_008908 [Vaccinium darrowii]
MSEEDDLAEPSFVSEGEEDLSMSSSSEAVVVQYVTYGPEQDQHDNPKYDVDGLTWRRGDLIGEGAFGSVYLATLKEPESQPLGPFPTQMAVKSAEIFDSGSLQNEKQVLSILHKTKKSPYIIQCFGDEYTRGEKGENLYNLLLEYASGGSLSDQIRKSRGSGLPESDVRHFARSILRGIKHVHDCGFVHLDIKPDNILLVPCVSPSSGSTNFMAKICDFGLAKRANQRKSSLRGTVMYLSPEAVTDGIQEAPSDVWAIGCVVLELLTAKQVWTRKPYWSTEEFVRKIGHKFRTPKIPSGISEEGKEFLKGCFQRKAADRLTIDMLLKLPFVSDVDDEEENIEIKAEESEPVKVMDENYDEVPEECDEDLSSEAYFDEDAEVEPIEEEEEVEEEGSPRQDGSSLIETMEDEPSVIYLGTLTNHEKRSPASDETIRNHKRRKLMLSSDTDDEEENIEIKVEESEPVKVMDKNYYEEPEECDEDPSNKVYFDEDAEVEAIEDEEEDEGSPRQDDCSLIETVEDESSVIYLGTVTNHENRRHTSDETIHNHKRRKLILSSDTDDERKTWLCSLPYALPVAAAF